MVKFVGTGGALWALLLPLMLLALAPVSADRGFFLRDGDRVLFLGDSITNAGMYVRYLDGYLRTRFPAQRFELINLGLSSETVSGLSEKAHPWPRPDVHERLERALTQVRPTVVVACYGMNDGIYHPYSPERFEKYQAGIRRLVEKARGAGVKRIVLLTPPPFDPVPMGEKTLPASAPDFSWMRPYTEYDGVLERYGRWVMTQKGEGVTVVNVHRPITRFLAEVRRENPRYTLAGDGIHLDSTGHWLIAREILRAWDAPPDVVTAAIDAAERRTESKQISQVSADLNGLHFTWAMPALLPADPGWDARFQPSVQALNRRVLRVKGLPPGRYRIHEDKPLGEATAEELAAGVDLARFPELSLHARSAELFRLLRERERLLSPAWLTAVGHKRPDTPAGLPLEEAQRRAAPLTQEIQRLSQPVPVRLSLLRVQ